MKSIYKITALVFLVAIACNKQQNDIKESNPVSKIYYENWQRNKVEIYTVSRKRIVVPYGVFSMIDVKKYPKFISAIRNLTIDMKEVPEYYSQLYALRNIERLCLENINADSVDVDFSKYRNLHTLIIGISSGKSLFEKHQLITSVTRISIVGCSELESIESGINDFRNLINLSFTNIPENTKYNFSFAAFKSLRNLNMWKCHMKTIPGDITSSQTIESLDLSGNELSDLPWNLVKMKKLKYLIVRHNLFAEKPTVLKTFKFGSQFYILSSKEIPECSN
ncbi:MAG: hypothetical protein A2W93_09645 [Bacteroidetes bacterium GWF2_43_63]|nr:MAG: hypothetical protein A2W94_07130 [Bacteroidetes bacterium GWE2_42_42]OFY54570.1 MAG: hypothetical protein A2W93_09645 [Bacteroidetes bacterium GWF2_43_63]HBG70620.1 hypothetical protein [Bacteroidales bacterium]HCB60917.1 hypothetical protein [Bacteroidales bacterium]